MLIYGADMTGSTHSSNKTDNFYCIGKAETQGLQNRKTIYAEHNYIETNGSEMKRIHVLFVILEVILTLFQMVFNKLNLKL